MYKKYNFYHRWYIQFRLLSTCLHSTLHSIQYDLSRSTSLTMAGVFTEAYFRGQLKIIGLLSTAMQACCRSLKSYVGCTHTTIFFLIQIYIYYSLKWQLRNINFINIAMIHGQCISFRMHHFGSQNHPLY